MAERDSKGKFKKGSPSPNKKGRPKGLGISAQIRKAISEKAPEIVDVLIAQALEGDAQAGLALLNKIVPNLKASNEPILFDINLGKGLYDTGDSIIKSIADGNVPLDSGAQLLSSLAALSKMQETDELAKRMDILEAHSGINKK